MGLVLRRAWEQFWQTQSFPLKVTLSPMGNGFLQPGRGGPGSAAHLPPRREPLLSWGQQGAPGKGSSKGVTAPTHLQVLQTKHLGW